MSKYYPQFIKNQEIENDPYKIQNWINKNKQNNYSSIYRLETGINTEVENQSRNKNPG